MPNWLARCSSTTMPSTDFSHSSGLPLARLIRYEACDSGWAICSVNSSGGEKYDHRSYFARVSGVAEWIAKVAPGVRFAP